MNFENGSCLCGSVKIGERGQVVIPKKAREYFDYHNDEELLVIADSEIGVTIIKANSVVELSKKLELYEKKYGEGTKL